MQKVPSFWSLFTLRCAATFFKIQINVPQAKKVEIHCFKESNLLPFMLMQKFFRSGCKYLSAVSCRTGNASPTAGSGREGLDND